MSVLVILAAVFAVTAVCAGFGLVGTLNEVCYPDLVCRHCGAIMPTAGHECSEGAAR